jgi:hypothetical protein
MFGFGNRSKDEFVMPIAENRRFVRMRPSGRVTKDAKIFADAKSPALDCTVIDISAGGVCLDVCGLAPIPKRFTVLHGGAKKHGRLVWQKGRRIGVAF